MIWYWKPVFWSFDDKLRVHLAILGQLMMMTGCGPSHTVARGLCRVTWISYYISPEYFTSGTDHIFFTIVTWISDNCWGSSKWLLKSYLAFNAIHQWDWLLFKPPALHLSQWRSRRSHAWWWWRGGSLWRVGKGGRASVDESFCNRKTSLDWTTPLSLSHLNNSWLCFM